MKTLKTTTVQPEVLNGVWEGATLFREHVLTNFMELNPSWEAGTCAAAQELSNMLWNPKVHYRVYKSPPLVPILSHIDPVHPTHALVFLAVSFLLAFPQISYRHSSSPPFLLHPLLISSSLTIHSTILGEEYRLWSSSLCSFLQSSFILSLFGPNILLSTLFSNTLRIGSAPDNTRLLSEVYI
jgi:hypothetical protein